MTTETTVNVACVDLGEASVSTGLPMLDGLLVELAETGRFQFSLEIHEAGLEEDAAAAGRALGRGFADALAHDAAWRRGWATLPAAEALATVALEVTGEPRLISNVDFSDQGVAGSASDVVAGFLDEFARAGGLNIHIRVLEGREPASIMGAIFKALGAALGQACRPAGGAR